MLVRSLIAAAVLATVAANANADIVYNTGTATGFFTPITSSTAAGVKYGDAGYFGNGSSPGVRLTSIRLGLATYSDTLAPAGKTDILFTLNNGDPSGQVFGNGATLYSTVIHDVDLPEADGSSNFFYLTIDLPSVLTAGGYNNVGWSVGVQNFNYTGSFGFQNHGDYNAVGFYTNNYSYYSPTTGWQQYAFGPNAPADIGNFVAQIQTPEPASIAVLGAAGAMFVRRRRSI